MKNKLTQISPLQSSVIKKISFFLIAFIATSSSFATVRTAVTGTWTTAASNTAFGVVTTSADSIIIPNGVTVTVTTAAVTCGAIIVKTGGNLTFSGANSNVIVTGGNGYSGTVTITGTITYGNANKQFIAYDGVAFTINSGATWTLAGSGAGDGGIHYAGSGTSNFNIQWCYNRANPSYRNRNAFGS